MAIKSNFRPATKISGRLDHSKMHNRLCGKLAASEMFPHLAIFHKPSHTKGLWKIAKPPKYCSSFSKQRIPEKNFSLFWIFFPGSTLKNFSWDLRRKIFYWPQIIQTFTRWIIPFQKIQTQNIKEFWKAHGILLPMGLGLPWKILH